MKVAIASGSRPKKELDLPATATLLDLKRAFLPTKSIHRMSFRLVLKGQEKPVTLNGDSATLASLGVEDGAELVFKDLGPQIGYRTVFVVEYAGPIAFMLFYAARPSFVYGATNVPFGRVQTLFAGLFIAHFVKRELETFFVHKFSLPTMPLMNIVKNSVYYWSFAAFIGYFLCHPLYTAPTHGFENIAAIAMVLVELGNLLVHVQLSGMRKKEGETTRSVPSGPLFSLVSCPNYTFEVLSWVFFSAGTNIAASWVFTAVGLFQMADWALKKHRGYIKQDPSCKRKKAIIPFLI